MRTNKEHIIDYISRYDDYLVCPIGGGRMPFHFLCLGHLAVSELLGFELERVSDVLQVVKPGQIPDDESLHKIIEKDRHDYSCFQWEVDALKWNLENYPDDLSGGGCFGPLTVVSGILGIENMLRMTIKKPAFVRDLLAYVTKSMCDLAETERDAGAEFFWIAEPLASVLSPDKFGEFSVPYLKEIYERACVPGFLHVCGPTLGHTTNMVKTGAEVLSIDYVTDIGKCLDMVPDNIVVMGNVSPINLRYGTSEEVKDEVMEVISKVGRRKNFVLSTGCSIIPGTPDENINVLFER